MTYLSRCLALTILVSPLGLANTVLDGFSICAKNGDSLQRLVCYDKLAEKALNSQAKQPKKLMQPKQVKQEKQEKQPKIQHQAPVQVVTHKQVDSVSQQQAKFGHENKQNTKDLVEQIEATIINIKKAPRGELIITLDNGQVWRQTDGIHYRLKKDQVVIIKRGTMGSFFIGKKNANKRIRAKRVK